MLRKLSILFVIIFSISFTTFAQSGKPKHADDILKSALSQATYYNKNVLVIFHSSWCGWCKRLIRVVNGSEVSNIFNNNFVITYIDVRERGELVNLIENPGGKEILAKFGGGSSGIPFYAFLDSKGNKITSSSGYPSSSRGVDDFVSMVKRSARNIDNGSLNSPH